MRFRSLDEAAAWLDRLEGAGAPTTRGGMSAYQVLIHCAQSIEYSMRGYPSSKGPLFQWTVGRIALYVFLARGAMRHDREEPIPGAPSIPGEGPLDEALGRLRTAIRDFHACSSRPAPHFAYGAVTKAQYDRVHAMHIADHAELVGGGAGQGQGSGSR